MAKVVIEFDPAIPEEREGVAFLFRSIPEPGVIQEPQPATPTVSPKGRGRHPKATVEPVQDQASYKTGDWTPAAISPERDNHGKTKYCQRCGMYMWKKYEHRRSETNPDLCDSCGGDAQRGADFSELPSIDTTRIGEVSS